MVVVGVFVVVGDGVGGMQGSAHNEVVGVGLVVGGDVVGVGALVVEVEVLARGCLWLSVLVLALVGRSAVCRVQLTRWWDWTVVGGGGGGVLRVFYVGVNEAVAFVSHACATVTVTGLVLGWSARG